MKVYMVSVDNMFVEIVLDKYLEENGTQIIPLEVIRSGA